MTIKYTEKGFGLHQAIEAAGHWLRDENGVWISDDDKAVQAIIDGYDALVAAKNDALAALADKRWQIENGGTTINGIPVSTDDRAKTLITGAADRARRGAQSSFSFKSADGEFVTIDAATMILLDDSICDFIQDCFVQEKALADLIFTATSEDEARAIDQSVGWPKGS
jgi:hypothetical protein